MALSQDRLRYSIKVVHLSMFRVTVSILGLGDVDPGVMVLLQLLEIVISAEYYLFSQEANSQWVGCQSNFLEFF